MIYNEYKYRILARKSQRVVQAVSDIHARTAGNDNYRRNVTNLVFELFDRVAVEYDLAEGSDFVRGGPPTPHIYCLLVGIDQLLRT